MPFTYRSALVRETFHYPSRLPTEWPKLRAQLIKLAIVSTRDNARIQRLCARHRSRPIATPRSHFPTPSVDDSDNLCRLCGHSPTYSYDAGVESMSPPARRHAVSDSRDRRARESGHFV